jgi:glycosyltransferase involved in cell wall biosynthesis
VEEGRTGLLVPAGDPNALARAIERYFDGAMGSRLRDGVASVRARYGWSALVEALLDLAGACA